MLISNLHFTRGCLNNKCVFNAVLLISKYYKFLLEFKMIILKNADLYTPKHKKLKECN